MVKRKIGKVSNVHKLLRPSLPTKFSLAFMSLLAASIVENSNFLAEVYFIFLKKRSIQSLKVFQYQILSSVKRLGK